MRTDCVIFDMDGTLVDSEGLSNQAFLDLIPEIDLELSELDVLFNGRRLTWIFDYIENRFGCILPGDIEQVYRQRVAELFDAGLQAFEGVHEALTEIGVPVCIATSAPPAKVAHALGKTGLTGFFGDRIFSSYDIGSWKPEPDIFLHAAQQMNVAAEYCLVVEDSLAGLAAAKAAGMRVVQYCPRNMLPDQDVYFRTYDQLKDFVVSA